MAAPDPKPRPLDALALAHQTRRLNRAPTPPWLHGEAARRMAERLALIRMQPRQIVDWDGFLGAGAELLRQSYPKARIVTVETDAGRLAARPRASWWPLRRDAAALAPPQLAGGQAQLLWANMALPRALRPQTTLAAWRDALALDGFLMFSTLGPGTLTELSALYAQAGWPAPLAPFVDMHDLGDMLVEAGFADPVMDQERLVLTWPNADALLQELHALGGNVDPQRHAGLRTPRWRERLKALLGARADASGRIALGFEIVYGHAFKPLPRPRVAAQTSVPLDDLRAMVRAGPRQRPDAKRSMAACALPRRSAGLESFACAAAVHAIRMPA